MMLININIIRLYTVMSNVLVLHYIKLRYVFVERFRAPVSSPQVILKIEYVQIKSIATEVR